MSAEKITTDTGPFSIVPEWLIDAPVSDRAVRLYATLARHADKQSRAWPRRKVLADRMRCAPASIDRAVLELRQVGAIEVQHRFDEGGQRSNSYVIRRVPASTGEDTPPHHGGGAIGTDEDGPLFTGDEQNESPSEREPLNEKNPSSAQGPSEVQQVFAAWLEASGKTSRTLLDAKRKRVIVKALSSYPLDEVLAAVRGWRNSTFHNGTEGKVHNDLGLLLRDAEHIERFRDLERAGPPKGARDRGMDDDRTAPGGREDAL